MIVLVLVALILGGVEKVATAPVPNYVTPCLGEPAHSPCNSGRGGPL